MSPKTSDRIKAMQERAAALAPPASPPAAPPDSEAAVVAVSAHFGATLDQLVRNRSVQRIPIGYIATDPRPEMRQPRLLPSPEQLIERGQAAPAYRELVAELLTLGQSLKEQQIQPIVVYAGTSDAYPAARYLILVGQRRWTAAHLVGLEALDAVVVEPPTPADRVRIQYAENEDREEFSDMERVWALLQMKQAMENAPWDAVEARLQMSRARRQQLLRLSAFTTSQQQHIARLRLQETQIRSLHTALRNDELSPAQVDAILQRLEEIAAGRSALPQDATVSVTVSGSWSRRMGIDGPTIARLVARAQRAATPAADTILPAPRWLVPLREQVLRAHQGVQRALGRVEMLGPTDAEALLTDLGQLAVSLSALMTRLSAPDEPDEPDE